MIVENKRVDNEEEDFEYEQPMKYLNQGHRDQQMNLVSSFNVIIALEIWKLILNSSRVSSSTYGNYITRYMNYFDFDM